MTAREAGIEALKNGDPKAALQHLAEAVRADANDAQAHAYLGTAYGQLNTFDQAAGCLARAVSLAPQSAALRYNHGMALERAGKRPEAVDSYREALRVDAGYERARQALVRLGEDPAPPVAAAPPEPPPASGLGEFAFGPNPAPVSSGEVTLAGAAFSAAPQDPTIITGSPWAAPSAPTLYGAPPVVAPQTPWAPAPGGPQPMGDWTPPAGGGLADYQTAPPRPQASATAYSPAAGAAVMTTLEAPEQQMPRSWMLGHCYLAGMSIGVWWGLIGAVVFVLEQTLTHTSSQMGKMVTTSLVGSLMLIALGALLYGVVGLIGGTTEEPDRTCGNLGVVVGILAALLLVPVAMGMAALGLFGMLGTILVSRLFGRSLGGRINDMQASVFVVTSASGVAMVRR
jgi:hypothetical protein